MILTRTPYRVSLFGGGTDYPEWLKVADYGAVFGMAIDKYCYVGVKPMPPGQMMRVALGELDDGQAQDALHEVPIRFRVQYSKVDDVTRVEDIKHPAVRGALKFFSIDEPLEFHCFGDLPGRSGLGGSSSFTVGLVHALRKLMPHVSIDDVCDAWSLTDEAIAIEREVIGETVGYQDQTFAAHGGFNLIEFTRDRRRVSRLDLPVATLRQLEESLFLVYSGTMRDAHVMAAKQVAQIPSPQKLNTMVRLREQALQAYRHVRDGRSIDDLGPMLDETWALKRTIAAEVSTDDIDELYRKGKRAGATGGKLLGAGGGGFMLFFVPARKRPGFRSMMSDHRLIEFRVSSLGSHVVIND